MGKGRGGETVHFRERDIIRSIVSKSLLKPTAVVAAVAACVALNLPALKAAVGRAPADRVALARDAGDVARFMAGMPGSAGSPFAALEADPAWVEHRRALDEAWQKAEAERLTGLRGFQKSDLDAAALRAPVVFYPFGGPDVLTATLYFPHNPTYVLVGLEPAGTLPSLQEISKKDLNGYLGALRETVANEVGHSFFVTREMDKQFRGQVTDGLLAPIAQLLVRMNDTILSLRYVRIDETGQVVERDKNYHAPGRIGNKGFEIQFRSDRDQSIHTLYYFSLNLDDDHLREDKQFVTYAASLKGAVTLLKATSYMTHQPEFSIVRQVILDNSRFVLQDDSGIPYHFFTPDAWKVQLYGAYTEPYGSFRPLKEEDLRKAYETGHPKPLPIAIGYGYKRVQSNLLLAERAAAPSR